MAICRIVLSFARVCRAGVWFGFVGSALLLAVGACIVVRGDAWPLLLSPCHTLFCNYMHVVLCTAAAAALDVQVRRQMQASAIVSVDNIGNCLQALSSVS